MKFIKKRYFLIIFIVLVFIVHTLTTAYTQKNIATLLNKKTESVNLKYKVIYNKYKDIADIIFRAEINKPEIIEIFKNKKREKLYKILSREYSQLKISSVRQLHFHLPNNDSFLRMHRPQKYGDNLTSARKTVAFVNKNLKPIDGFEEGKIFNGFRFVYPLFDKKEHIGSVEISFSALAFIKDIVSEYEMKSNFHISKKVVYSKVFNEEKSNYSQSFFPEYFCQKSILKYIESDPSHNTFTLKQKEDLQNKIQKEKSFSIYNKELSSILTLLPIINPITHQSVAFFTFENHDITIASEIRNSQIIFFSSIIIIGILFVLLYKEFLYKYNLQREIEEKTQDIQASFTLLDNVIKGANLGYWDWYPQTKEYIVNDRLLDILGITRDEILGTQEDWTSRVYPPDLQEIEPIINDALESNKHYNVEYRMIHKDSHFVWIKGSGCVMERDTDNRPLRVSGTHTDITQNKEMQTILETQKDTLEYQANHDPLTELRNRLYLDRDVQELITKYNEYQAPYAFLMFDIDFFKDVNDSYGHDVGDEVLVEIAKSFKTLVRGDDKVYRAGGEEFVILLKGTSLEDSLKIAQKIRLKIKSHIFKVKDATFSKTISGGIFHSSHIKVTSTKEIFKLTDDALYFSKHNGRDQITTVKQ